MNPETNKLIMITTIKSMSIHWVVIATPTIPMILSPQIRWRIMWTSVITNPMTMKSSLVPTGESPNRKSKGNKYGGLPLTKIYSKYTTATTTNALNPLKDRPHISISRWFENRNNLLLPPRNQRLGQSVSRSRNSITTSAWQSATISKAPTAKKWWTVKMVEILGVVTIAVVIEAVPSTWTWTTVAIYSWTKNCPTTVKVLSSIMMEK